MSRNVAASVRARLKNHADATGDDYNLLLTRYGLERLLYRLSVSKHSSNFLLKGALLFLVWHDLPNRPTRDADLLGFGADDIDSLVAVFQDVCAVPCEDGVQFENDAIHGEAIRKQAGYGGVRIGIPAMLDGAKLALQVDVGFGDVVTPQAEAIIYPVLLDDQPPPHLRAYPRYTVCAEKLQAMCRFGITLSEAAHFLALPVQEPGEAIRATIDKIRKRMTYAVEKGKLDCEVISGTRCQWQTTGGLMLAGRHIVLGSIPAICQFRDNSGTFKPVTEPATNMSQALNRHMGQGVSSGRIW